MPQYLSTDPNAGKDESQYLSTDPNAGDVQQQRTAPKSEHPHARIGRLVKENLPAIGATVAALGSGGAAIPAIALAALGGGAGKAAQIAIEGSAKSVPEMATDIATEGGMQGVLQAAGGGLAKGAAALARPLMRQAMGAQAAVRRAFPTVDLERVALREGVAVPDVGKAQRLGREAAANVQQAGRAADAAGAPKIRAKEIIPELRPVFQRAKVAERGGISGATDRVVDTARNVRRMDHSGGLSVEDALTAKSEWQRLARPAYGAQPGALPAPDPRVSRAVATGLTKAARGRSPEVGKALDRSQEIMALERAITSIGDKPSRLALLLGAGAGGVTGLSTGDPLSGAGAAAVPLALSNPRVLSRVALGMHRAGKPQADAALLRAIRSLFGTESEPQD